MTEQEQIGQLETELGNLIERFSEEYELSYASVIGVLQMKIILLTQEAQENLGPEELE